jgi:DNA-directed RNA polymerase I subunit RPA1
MAHVVRILHNPTQKTIRMHYANCNTYNADFDGDEMNCHFPQNDLASAESKYIASTDLQYIAPTDGTPLRGLIQDHVDAGVKMCCKNTFLEKWEYQQLLFAALVSLPGLELIRMDADIELMPPAILKPRPLWTGKQVISTLLNHLRKNNDRDDVGERKKEMPGISVERKAKTPEVGFGASEMEHLVIIRDGELLRGVLDKNAFGSTEFSLVHAVYEAYGPPKAGLLLNSLGRLFTAYLQYYSGHSCRMEDLLLTQAADAERRQLVQRAYNVGARSAKAWADSDGGKVQIESIKDKPGSDQPLKPVEAAATAVKIGQLLSGKEGQANFAALDGYMQSQLNPLASEIIKACLPKGLNVPFPENTFSLMVTTGAKGSMVNQSQVSCALGQQALEGRRVPRLASGRTLPSFAPYDPSPRADGFIMDRFLTGVRPQEYYFHCMAGREGLIDTAVKTSRSGYLQRCLVKHLEELKVCYDSTVRNGEGGVVQFLYGEDGLDTTKAAFLDCASTTFQYMARNHESLSRQYPALPDASIDTAASDYGRVQELEKDSGNLTSVGSFVHARKLRVGSQWFRGAFCRGWFDATITKVNSDGTFDLKYIKDGQTVKDVPVEIELRGCGGRKTSAIYSTAVLIKPGVADPMLSGGRREDGVHLTGASGACVSEKVAGAAALALKKDKKLQNALKSMNLTSKDFGRLVAAKYGSALVAPGEAVGSIAAQSVGEPSTQMTLNTFHLAGAGANVTLGIPRLREIIMTASRQLKTPTMSVPLKANVTEKQALRLTRKFTKLNLGELIAGHNGVIVNETLQQGDGGNWERAYHVTLTFHPPERIKEAFGLNLDDIAGVVMRAFKPKLADIMKKELKRSTAEGDVASIEVAGGHAADFATAEKPSAKKSEDKDVLDEEDADDGDDEAIDAEDGVNAERFGHRKEESYGDMDDDDRDVAADRNGGLLDDEAEEADGDDDDDDEEEDSHRVTFRDEDTANLINKTDEAKLDHRRNSITLPSLRVDPAARPLLMVGLIERAASVTMVRSRPLIDKAFINDEEGDRGRCLQTAGCNFSEFWALENVVHDKLASNDIWAVRCAYGVEAARNNIVEQIQNVFGAYGICVDPRHLSLIADYMTFDGGFKPMNRNGMADVGSPFLQMSFETTAGFMTEAALNSRVEACNSPSANIVVGRPIRHGTGAFDLLTKS